LLGQVLAGLARQRAQRDPLQIALAPQVGELLVDLGARERQHHQRLLAQRAQGGVDQLQARAIAPLDVLEHQQNRVVRALGGQPVDPGGTQAIAHQARIAARGVQRRARALVEGNADQLAQELPDRGVRVRAQAAGHQRAHLLPPQLAAVGGGDACGRAQRRSEQAERRSDGDRVAPADQDL
jgi:hypothetical protein